jgi:hypothetical protein
LETPQLVTLYNLEKIVFTVYACEKMKVLQQFGMHPLN